MENQGYCMKCKGKREISNPLEVVMNKKGGKKGRALTGTCIVCGTKMYKILPKKVETPLETPPVASTELPTEAPKEVPAESEADSFDQIGL